MRTFYLRFANRDEWRGLGLIADSALRVDRVGAISEPTGEVGAEGSPEVAPLDGYHVNIICTDDRDLSAVEPFVVTPADPARVWAGFNPTRIGA